MATYQFELGINGSNLPAAGTNGHIQVGFVNMTQAPFTVAYPGNIQAGDHINFYVFDTGSTDGGKTTLLSNVQLTVKSTPNASLFTQQPNSASLTAGTIGNAYSFGGGSANNYCYWGYSLSDVNTGVNSGMYSLTFTITANVNGTPYTWVRDPEMIVGGWG